MINSKFIIYLGLFILLVGIVLFIFEKNNINIFKWLGNLPGDIKIEKDNFTFYFPVTTMIIISLLITLILKIINKFF
jgi:hypothetical protein